MIDGVAISKRLIAINATATVLQRVLSLSVLLWLQQWLMGKVHEDEYAVYTLLFALMVYVPLLTGILGGALARFVTHEYARRDGRRVTEIVSTMWPLCLLGAALILAVGLPAAWNIDSLVRVVKDPANPRAAALVTEAKIMFAVMVAIAALRTAMMPFRLGINIKQKFWLGTLIGVGIELVRIGVLFALLFGIDTRVLWVVVATVPATLLDVGIITWLSRRLVPELRFERSAFRPQLFRPILSYGWWTLLIRLVVMLRETITLLLLDRFAGSVAVGTAGVASKFDNQIRRNALMLAPTMQPALTAMHATGQYDRLRRTYFRFSRYLLWVFLAIATPLIVYRQELWTLYLSAEEATKYRDAGLVMAILLARLLVVFPQAPIAAISVARGHSKPVALCALVIELSTVAVAAYLIVAAEMGALGFAIAVTGVALVGHPLLFWTLGLQMVGARLRDFARLALWPGLLPALAATPVWLLAERAAPPQSWPALIAHGAAGGVVFTAVLLRFCLQPDERADLHKLLVRLRLRRQLRRT